MNIKEFTKETKKTAINAVKMYFYPLAWVWRKIRSAWNHFTYIAGW